MGFPNRFEAKCADCGAKVKVGRGVTSGSRGAWITVCQGCSVAAPPPSPPVVRVTKAGISLAFATSGKLGDDAFAAYRAAVAGGRYEERVNYLRPEIAAGAIAAILAIPLPVEVSPEAQALVDAHATATVMHVAAAQERVATVEAVLAESGRRLYPYQREGVQWLASRTSALLADDMGLGKTIQCLTAIPAGAPVIVVCPAVAKSVWQIEAARWRTDLRVAVLAGRGSFRAPEAGELVAINYDILPGEPKGSGREATVEGIPAILPGTCLVLDEAHACASSKSARTKKVRALSEAVRRGGGRVYVLTATPLKSKPPELWAVLECAGLAREAFGSWGNFRELFHARDDRWGGTTWGSASAEVPSLLRRVMLRRIKADVLADLPPKTHATRLASIDRATAKLCDEALAELGGVSGIEEAADKLGRTNGLSFATMSAARAALARAKIPAMLEIVEAHETEEEPLVVFSAYRAPIDLLGAREGWATITGDTSPEARGEIVRRFQASELMGVACTIRAGGVAITLTRASNVLRVDREWTPALNVQAEDRCYRIGQANAVLVTDLVAEHPLDQRIAEVLAAKEALISGSVDAATVQHVAPQVAPAIDWAAVEAAASIAADEYERVRAESAAALGERAKKLAARKLANIRANAIDRVRESAAARLCEPIAEEDAPRRGPQSEVEAWAMAGLRQLAADDADRARERNEVGFSASDGHLGHALAWLGELTSQEWRLAIRIARHYPGQVAPLKSAPELQAAA